MKKKHLRNQIEAAQRFTDHQQAIIAAQDQHRFELESRVEELRNERDRLHRDIKILQNQPAKLQCPWCLSTGYASSYALKEHEKTCVLGEVVRLQDLHRAARDADEKQMAYRLRPVCCWCGASTKDLTSMQEHERTCQQTNIPARAALQRVALAFNISEWKPDGTELVEAAQRYVKFGAWLEQRWQKTYQERLRTVGTPAMPPEVFEIAAIRQAFKGTVELVLDENPAQGNLPGVGPEVQQKIPLVLVQETRAKYEPNPATLLFFASHQWHISPDHQNGCPCGKKLEGAVKIRSHTDDSIDFSPPESRCDHPTAKAMLDDLMELHRNTPRTP